jgi:hypothetical protein
LAFSVSNRAQVKAALWISLIVAVAVLGGFAFLLRPQLQPRGPVPNARLSRPLDPTIVVALQHARDQSNPAFQKAGPPNPQSQEASARAAVSAAQEAAALAESSSAIH